MKNEVSGRRRIPIWKESTQEVSGGNTVPWLFERSTTVEFDIVSRLLLGTGVRKKQRKAPTD